VEREVVRATSTLFWPEGIRQLVVVSFPVTGDSYGTRVAYGVDLDRHRLVFQVELRPVQLQALIDTLRNAISGSAPLAKPVSVAAGIAPQLAHRMALVAPLDDIVDPPVVVIPNSGPGDPSPTAAVDLATALFIASRTAGGVTASG
jgi:hypothetical protein